MDKFKVGDRVKCITENWNYCSYKPDKIYTVKSCSASFVVTDLDGEGNGENGWGIENFELVSPNSPIRTVTNLELVHGTYGIVSLRDYTQGLFVDVGAQSPTGADLRAAAKTLTEIADYLEAQ